MTNGPDERRERVACGDPWRPMGTGGTVAPSWRLMEPCARSRHRATASARRPELRGDGCVRHAAKSVARVLALSTGPPFGKPSADDIRHLYSQSLRRFDFRD